MPHFGSSYGDKYEARELHEVDAEKQWSSTVIDSIEKADYDRHHWNRNQNRVDG